MSKRQSEYVEDVPVGWEEGAPEGTISSVPVAGKRELKYHGYAVKGKAKKIAVGMIGGIVLVLGLALIVLPGPAFLVIPAGLAILASEFDWARRMKERCERRFHQWRGERKKRKAQKRAQIQAI